MKQYLTISEFANLRNVSIGSLRYYEKLKILVPAWTDPQTKYRYYLPEQLGVLDSIMLCTKLGIPLKNLEEYIDTNGKLNQKSILENGKKILQDKISEIQLGLELTQFNLDNMEQNQNYCNQKGVYTRQIEERYFIESSFQGNWSDFSQKEKEAMDLFHSAQENNMAPVFPCGVLIHYETEPISFSFFVQVLHPQKHDERVIHIPKASFSCMQTDLTSQTDILKILNDYFPTKDKQIVIISNMLMNKIHFHSRHIEIQIPTF